MNHKFFKIVTVLSAMFLFNGALYGSFIAVTKQEKQESSPSTIEKQLQTLEKEKNELEEIERTTKKRVDEITADIAQLKEALARNSTTKKEYLNQRLSVLGQIQQVLTEISQAHQQHEATIAQHSEELQDYKADPDFNKLKLARKTAPDFNDWREFVPRLNEKKKQITALEKNKASITYDLNRRKKNLLAIQEQYKEKQKQQDQLNDQKPDGTISARERGQLLDDNMRLLLLKKELAELKVKEAEARLLLINTQLEHAKEQLAIFEKDYAWLKRTLVIDSAYLKRAEGELEKKRQLYGERRERLYEKLGLISPLRQEFKKRIELLREQLKLGPIDIEAIEKVAKEPKVAQEWLATCALGLLIWQEKMTETEHDFIEAQLDLEKAKFYAEEIGTAIIKSWYLMTQKKIPAKEEIDQEIKSYDLKKNELQVDLSVLTEKWTQALNLLPQLNATIDKIKALSAKFKDQKGYFKDTSAKHTECLKAFYDTQELIRHRIELLTKMIDLYATTMASLNDSLKKTEDITNELTTKGLWQRSAQAIEWSELKNFFPDLKRFFADFWSNTKAFLTRSHLLLQFKHIAYYASSFSLLMLLLVRLIIVLLIYLILRIYIPDFRNYLASLSPHYGLFSTLFSLLAALLSFIYNHLVSIYLWFVIFLAIKLEFITDTYLATLFYLLSIGYVLFMTYRFLTNLITLNMQRNYAFISASYQQRFLWIIAPVIYATIILSFLREAFVLNNYATSQVPVILLAVNFILLQVALLSLIGKEQVLSLIPKTTPLWEWVEEHVDKYYYIILLGIIAIIVMSNPYVGYGKQVLYVLSRLFITLLLIPLFSWLHNRIKKTSSDLFFYYSDGEILKERFTGGKTWYGLFVIATFMLFILLGVTIINYVWTEQIITWREISRWLEHRIYSPGIDETTGKVVEVTALSLFKICMFIIGGIVLTYIINNFILRRIFDPLLIGSGVQNTIFTLSKYIIVVIAFLIGMQNAGLDAMTLKIGALVALLSYYFRETVTDFFAYFIILIQRPIKIGDLVMIENEIMGVVRQITPRSTIIRRRNSTTLVIPNSHIITKVITNWNYTRTFFAFDDMFITIPYTSNPDFVKKLITQVLEENNNVLKNPAPIVWLHNFTDNGFQFLVRGYLTADKVLDQWDIASNIRLDIIRKLRQANIEVAIPSRLLKIVPAEQNFDQFNQTPK